jgi:hypothetical protein
MMKMFLFRRATAPRDAERQSLLSTAAVSKRFEDEDDSLALLSQLHQQQQSTPLGLSPEDEAAAKRSLLKQVPGDDAGMSDLILELVLRHFLPSIKKQLSLYLEQNTQHIHTLCGTTEQEVRFYASQATLQHSEGASFHSQSSSSSLTSVTRVASSVIPRASSSPSPTTSTPHNIKHQAPHKAMSIPNTIKVITYRGRAVLTAEHRVSVWHPNGRSLSRRERSHLLPSCTELRRSTENLRAPK